MSVWELRAINRGRAAPFRGNEPSAIAKAPVDRAVTIGPLGVEGDEQADPVHHGGPDMALHHYPHEHYAWWRARIGAHPLLDGEGAFGENISTDGLDETVACIGDRFRLGTALIELSQPRVPCWKLSHRFAVKTVTADVVSSGRCGWYYRVLEPGLAGPGDRLALLERPHPQWSAARVFALMVRGEHKAEPGVLAELAALAPLSAEWRARAAGLAS